MFRLMRSLSIICKTVGRPICLNLRSRQYDRYILRCTSLGTWPVRGISSSFRPQTGQKRRLRPEDYTVGWVSALSIELAAAIEMLDEEHADLPQHPDDTNVYTVGRMGEHNVAIACLPEGQTGNNSAAAVAMRMKAKFPTLRFGLMVGIGGGVPDLIKGVDIRLGDVVISKPRAQHSGVVQYDFGKNTPGGFERTGYLNTPPGLLLSAVAKMEAQQHRGQSAMQSYLARFAPKFSRENAGPDRLFKASFTHVIGGSRDCHVCLSAQERIEDVLEQRPQRPNGEIRVHYGTIASGNQVIKDGITRDAVSKALGGVLCFEMEAAGLMNTFPCLVIRGICDYADSHKNNMWQPFAAATAAACAREVLSVIVRGPAVLGIGEGPESRLTIYEERKEGKLFILAAKTTDFIAS